jgi:hypothetical protein
MTWTRTTAGVLASMPPRTTARVVLLSILRLRRSRRPHGSLSEPKPLRHWSVASTATRQRPPAPAVVRSRPPPAAVDRRPPCLCVCAVGRWWRSPRSSSPARLESEWGQRAPATRADGPQRRRTTASATGTGVMSCAPSLFAPAVVVRASSHLRSVVPGRPDLRRVPGAHSSRLARPIGQPSRGPLEASRRPDRHSDRQMRVSSPGVVRVAGARRRSAAAHSSDSTAGAARMPQPSQPVSDLEGN